MSKVEKRVRRALWVAAESMQVASEARKRAVDTRTSIRLDEAVKEEQLIASVLLEVLGYGAREIHFNSIHAGGWRDA